MRGHAQSGGSGICDRTEQVRDAIVDAVSGVGDCADITATHLGQVTNLYLVADNIAALQSTDFAGLTALDSLNLAFNKLRTLPSGVFDDLTSLTFLQLAGNDLIQLPDRVFAGLTSLTTLGLRDNLGYPFGPTARAGPSHNVGADAKVTLTGSSGGDPWGRDVTYAWTQSDATGVVVPLAGANTATPSLTAPAVEEAVRLDFTLAVTAINPGGITPPGTTTAGDVGLHTAYVHVDAAEQVTVSFVRRSYTATEGGSAARVGIRLNRIPRRTVSIPLEAVPADGSDAGDYSVPKEVTFGFVDQVKYVTVTATDDDRDDDGESVTLRFGSSLPVAVMEGRPATMDVALADNDDPVGASIDGFTVTSDPGADATYSSGDVIEVTATFSEAVTVSGQPQLTLNIGTYVTELLGQAARNAGYVSGSGTEALVFAYRVAAGDSDPDGVSIAAGDLLLNGGTIRAGGGVNALLGHDGLDPQPGHKVDALAPTFSEAFVNGLELKLRYTEPLDEGSVPAASAFRVNVNGVRRNVSNVGIDEKLVTLTLASAVAPGEQVTASYSVPGSDPIRDRAGLAADSFTDEAVTNYSAPGVSIRAIDPAVYEGEDVDFKLFRNGPASRSLRVTVEVDDSGDVLRGAEGSRRVTFAAGDSTAWLTLRTHDDHSYEAHATVTATVVGGGDHIVSETHGSASVTVSDNNLPDTDVTLDAADSVDESVGRFTVEVSASTVADEEPHGSLSVRLGSADGTATSGQDGDFAPVDEVIRFVPEDFERVVADGVARYVATLEHQIAIHNDGIEEEDETFELELTRSYVIADKVNLPAQPLEVTIVDNDDGQRPEIRVTPIVMFMHEGESKGYRVSLKSAPAGTVTVTVGGWSGTDVSAAPTSLDFTASNWSDEQTVTVTAEQDDETDNDEVMLTHSAGDGDEGPTVEVTVADNDVPMPSLSLRALADSVREGEFARFEITRTGPFDRTLLAGIIVWDLEEYYADAWVAAYFHEGEGKDTVYYPAQVDTLVTTDRTVRVAVNPYLDGYEVGSPSEVEVHVIDQTSGTGGDVARAIRVFFGAAPPAVAEGGAGVAVVVRLSEPAAAAVRIPLATRGLGGAGEEDWDVASEVMIEAGESELEFRVAAVDDSDEDPGESLELSFGTLPKGFAAEDPRTMVVDIDDNDVFVMGTEETRAWLARFGRAMSGDAVEAVRGRMAAARHPSAESRVTVGGHELQTWKDALFSGGLTAGTGPARVSASETVAAQPTDAAGEFLGRLLSGTSFSRTGAPGLDASGRWSVWGRGGKSGFSGRDGSLSLTGDLITITLGADYGTGPALGGVVLSRGIADGTLTGSQDVSGQVETTLTAAYPWLRYALSDRVAVWGMGGYGSGAMTMAPGDAAIRADFGMRMGAAGATGQLVATGTFTLAFSSDAMFTRTRVDGAASPDGVEADVSRVRVMIESSSSLRFAGGTFTPTFELGVRQDGGDAETGRGLELGGGFGYTLPSLGLSVGARARGLVAHEDGGYGEWGASGSLRISPDPTGRGLNLNLSPSWGSADGGGVRTLWSRRDMTGIATGRGAAANPDGGSVALEMGYGIALTERVIATPFGGATQGTRQGTRRLGLNVEGFERFRLALEVGRSAAREVRLGVTGTIRR